MHFLTYEELRPLSSVKLGERLFSLIVAAALSEGPDRDTLTKLGEDLQTCEVSAGDPNRARVRAAYNVLYSLAGGARKARSDMRVWGPALAPGWTADDLGGFAVECTALASRLVQIFPDPVWETAWVVAHSADRQLLDMRWVPGKREAVAALAPIDGSPYPEERKISFSDFSLSLLGRRKKVSTQQGLWPLETLYLKPNIAAGW